MTPAALALLTIPATAALAGCGSKPAATPPAPAKPTVDSIAQEVSCGPTTSLGIEAGDLFDGIVSCGGNFGATPGHPMTLVVTFAGSGEETEWVDQQVAENNDPATAPGSAPQVIAGSGWALWTHDAAVAAKALDLGGTAQ